MFVCILRALTRTQNTHKHVEKDELRLRRNVYERIAPTVLDILSSSSAGLDR